MYSVVKTQWRGYVELLSSLVHNRIGCCPFWYADATIHLVELLLFHLFLLFFLFHNDNTIIMLTRCVRWSRPVLLWNIVCSSVNVVHQLLVELHFLFFFLFHNDMSFKLFTQVSEVTKPPPVGADPCVCPTPKGVPQRLNRWKYVVPTLGGHMGPPLQSGGYGTSET